MARTAQEAKNERLWFKTNLKLGKLWYDREEYGRLQKILKELQRSCQQADGSDDPKKGTQLLEVYALEIQVRRRPVGSLYRDALPEPRDMRPQLAASARLVRCRESVTSCPPTPHVCDAHPPP